jgi:hypothetical protein
MSPDQLEQERRFGRIAAAAAVASAISLYAGVLWAQLSYADAPDNKPARLRYFDQHAGEILGSAAVQTLGWLLLTVVAVHLYRAIKARRPDEPVVVLVLGVYGPVALAAVTLARAVALTMIAGDFADSPSQTLEAADDALNDPALLIPQFAGISAVLALAFWLVKGSLDAMRIGLLTRFMGVLGIGIALALVLQFGSLILPLWLIALALLFLHRWPRGTPPAWEAGKAIPWEPSGRRAQEEPESEQPGPEGRNGEVEPVGPGVRRTGRRRGRRSR